MVVESPARHAVDREVRELPDRRRPSRCRSRRWRSDPMTAGRRGHRRTSPRRSAAPPSDRRDDRATVGTSEVADREIELTVGRLRKRTRRGRRAWVPAGSAEGASAFERGGRRGRRARGPRPHSEPERQSGRPERRGCTGAGVETGERRGAGGVPAGSGWVRGAAGGTGAAGTALVAVEATLETADGRGRGCTAEVEPGGRGAGTRRLDRGEEGQQSGEEEDEQAERAAPGRLSRLRLLACPLT